MLAASQPKVFFSLWLKFTRKSKKWLMMRISSKKGRNWSSRGLFWRMLAFFSEPTAMLHLKFAIWLGRPPKRSTKLCSKIYFGTEKGYFSWHLCSTDGPTKTLNSVLYSPWFRITISIRALVVGLSSSWGRDAKLSKQILLPLRRRYKGSRPERQLPRQGYPLDTKWAHLASIFFLLKTNSGHFGQQIIVADQREGNMLYRWMHKYMQTVFRVIFWGESLGATDQISL